MGGSELGETARRPARRGGRGLVRALPAGLALAGLLSLVGTGIHAGGEERATRAELEAGRRRAARLESEVALASTRKVYIVLDLEARALRYQLMGMTMREIPVEAVEVDGLVVSREVNGNAKHLAGIFTLREKEGDPRLDPLTPEQVEAGAADENVAAVFPPEPPKAYRLAFKQPVAIRVSGKQEGTGVKGVAYRLKKALGGWFGGGGAGAAVRIDLHLEPDAATEFWRSIIPDQRWLILPPPGQALPDAGQEAPPKPKAPRAAPPAAAKAPPPEEVPFRIPPPEQPPEAGDDADGGPAPKPAERLDEPRPKKPPVPPGTPPGTEPETPPAPGDEPPPPDPGRRGTAGRLSSAGGE